MKNKLIIVGFLLSIVGVLSFSLISGANTPPQLPEPPVNEQIRYPANTEKILKDVNKFLSEIESPYSRPDAIITKKQKILYKNIRQVLPYINDRMNWVHPDRQIFVFESKFETFSSPKIGTVTNALVYDMYDAETGEHLGGGIRGDADPNYIPPNKR